MKAIFILLDTLNRRMLDIYGQGDTALTPNIRRLAERGVVFDNHWCGSAPCMPARRDILTGRLNFLEKPWGGMEPFDFTLPWVLAKHKNVHSTLFSDHPHYVISGGENYTRGFTAWNVFRGQEEDPVYTRPDKTGIRGSTRPEGYKGVWTEAEQDNRLHYPHEQDYPSVRTLSGAADWLEDNRDADNFLLWAEAFDPHEPYDTPKYYLDLYEKPGEYDGPNFTHPSYARNEFSEAETRHLRNACKAVMTMTDRHVGEILDVMDKYDMWKDTMVIFTTDHGFHLGEHGFMAKNYMPPYNEVFHIPMIVCHPDIKPGRCSALTQNIDVLPSVLEYFGVSEQVIPYPLHGRSLLPLLRGEKDAIHEDIIYGYFGHEVAYNDGTYTYIRAAKDDSDRPLNMYTAVPSLLRQLIGADDACQVTDYSRIDMGRYLSWTEYPVFRFPADIIHWSNDSQVFDRRREYNRETMLFNIREDYAQEHPIHDEALQAQMAARLKAAMERVGCPEEQFERLAL